MKSILKVAFVLLACLALAPVSLFAQGSVTGFVYADANANGKRDTSERGIGRVAVSNGVEVVLTDASGRYTLPIANDTTIFVIKPAGYNVPRNELNQPQYFYVHKPSGSPRLQYKAFDPTPAARLRRFWAESG